MATPALTATTPAYGARPQRERATLALGARDLPAERLVEGPAVRQPRERIASRRRVDVARRRAEVGDDGVEGLAQVAHDQGREANGERRVEHQREPGERLDEARDRDRQPAQQHDEQRAEVSPGQHVGAQERDDARELARDQHREGRVVLGPRIRAEDRAGQAEDASRVHEDADATNRRRIDGRRRGAPSSVRRGDPLRP
jgi:hypothetical protein